MSTRIGNPQSQQSHSQIWWGACCPRSKGERYAIRLQMGLLISDPITTGLELPCEPDVR